MKTFLARLLLALALIAAPVVFTGCAGGPERTALNVVKMQITTVDTAMQAFTEYERIHGMDAPTRLRVKALYAEHVRHNLAVERAWLAYRTALESAAPDAPALEKHLNAARAILLTSQTDLIALIQSILNH